MNHILIEFQSNDIVIEAKSANQLSKKTLNKNDEMLPEKLVQIIKTMNGNYDGGIVKNENIPPTTLNKYLFSLQNGTVVNICEFLTEQTNIIFITTEAATKVTNLQEAFNQAKEEFLWTLSYYGCQKGKAEYCIESLLTTGNGYLGLRGSLIEMKISDDHYPATYIAGLYNQATSLINQREVLNEDFVNAPNFQKISFAINDEEFALSKCEIEYLKRSLDLRKGVWTATGIYTLSNERKIQIEAKRIVSMKKMTEYCIQYAITPLNFSAKIEVISIGDGDVYNYNVERYRGLERHHLDIVEISADHDEITLLAKTKTTNIYVLQQAKLTSNSIEQSDITTEIQQAKIIQRVTIDVEKATTITFEKQVQVSSFSENEQEKLQKQNSKKIVATSFFEYQEQNIIAWQQLWSEAKLEIDGDIMSQKLLNIHIYHLLISNSPMSSRELDVSITARGLHGECYRGHIFWDEIFIMPFYCLNFPELAKHTLLYRYNRMTAAKKAAKEAGYKGAMFPWQSGLDGSEQTQSIHLNPLSGEWDPDYSLLQRHVSLAIAYNVWLYFHTTNDETFMREIGAELLLEIASFWCSAAEFYETTERYFIDKVMGPDEFHESYPHSKDGGLKNNAYTNIMVAWLFGYIKDVLAQFPPEIAKGLTTKVELSTKDFTKMQKMQKQLELEIAPDGVIAQYKDYFKLKEIDLDYYREKYGNIYRMDRILRAEGKSADEYKVAKQADTLQTFFNFNTETVTKIITNLGYSLPKDYLEKNLEYYLKRTSHGSTLSRIVHAQLAGSADNQELAWQLYQEALYSDYRDIQGGTTAEGIHTGVMAATIYITILTFMGIDVRGKQLQIQPNLPKHWQRTSCNILFKGGKFAVTVTRDKVSIYANKTATVIIYGKAVTIKKDTLTEVTMNKEAE